MRKLLKFLRGSRDYIEEAWAVCSQPDEAWGCGNMQMSYTIPPMQDKKVIVLVGMPGAGKSMLVDHLEAQEIPSVYFGGITIDEVIRRGLEVTEANERTVREEIRDTEGKGAYAKRIIPQIEQFFNEGHKKVVADGLYSWTEYKIFKEHFGDDAIIIAVVAPRKLRHERLTHRPDRPLTDEQVTSREYAEIENIEKGGPIANADYTLVNDNTPEALTNALDKVLEQS
jgi:dephospho-CoA kinase